MFSQLATYFASPTPPASLVSGLITLAILAALYAIFQWNRGRRDKTKAPVLDALIVRLRAFDCAVVHVGSWFVGTRSQQPWVRRILLVAIFTGLALAGALFPWP